MRFWRNTSVADLAEGASATLADGTLGYEWDEDLDNGFRPAGLVRMSTTTVENAPVLADYGSTFGIGYGDPLLTLYRAVSGALVFGAGTVQWSWGLDANHDRAGTPIDARMQQATVNLFADMGVQPATLQQGLIVGTASTDATAPISTITTPSAGATVPEGIPMVISGTATDAGGGVVGAVEVSVDGGTTWHPASGRSSWSYTWVPMTTGPVTIQSRAVDDSGNLETPSAGVTLSVAAPTTFTIWPSTAIPSLVDAGADNPVALGVKFRSDVAGTIIGIRFYKASTNTGTHVGNLWSSTGALLATATFTNETNSGWQQVNFSNPVPIDANTVYVASYHANAGHYSFDANYFATTGVDSPPLHALADGESGGNGIYAYGASSAFPTQTVNSANYWVDVVFDPAPTPTLDSIAVTPANPTMLVGQTQQFTATGTYSDSSTQDLSGQVTWASSQTGVATIDAAGLATGLSDGATTISATLGGVSGGTGLTVQASPLSITTASLPDGTVGAAYSATLAATGGSLPYSWSITIGSLPSGLSLNATTGLISGTPTAAATPNFTVEVTDSAGPAATSSKALSISVAAAPTTFTIWPSTAVPSLVDAGADSPVELGVKFRSDVAGTIIGIRFYKASTNTGTHVGNLWSSTGGLLATATFTNETASGWQQVDFSSPVPIDANTVYVASYHASAGHFSVDWDYFATTGVDNPPLHALADGESGGNGVYAYGASSTFPTQTVNSANYWVDVVFDPAPVPTLDSIAVTPANPTIPVGGTQQFTATGTYSDSSTQDLSDQVTWASSQTGVATIDAAGLATGLSDGATTISATLGGVFGSTGLTVQAAPLSITTTSLPDGTVGAAYSATLAATGGTSPYSWSVTGGSLPSGLSLNATTGVISGTPTAAATSNFTVEVTDSAGPAATSSKALSISVAAAPTTFTIWPSTAIPSLVDAGADSPVELGVKFRSDVAGIIIGIRFYKASTNTGTHVGNLWSSTGGLLATATFTNETDSGWQQVNFSNPVPIDANTVYVASYHANGGHYSFDANYFATTGMDSPPLHALADGESGGNGVYAYGASSAFPTQTANSANYWVDVVFDPAPAPTLDSIAVTPANPTIPVGGAQQFTATGTYSDSSTQDLSDQVTWASSQTGVATIDAAGLATGLSDGATTISATLGGVFGSTGLTVQAAPLSITTTSLPDGTVGAAYSATLAATGGTLPYSWSVTGGSLPSGLSLNATTGVISGTPTAAATPNFTVEVTDSAGPAATSSKALSISVAAAPTADMVGIRRNTTFFLDLSGNNAWDGPAIDGVYGFGAASDVSVTGDWNGDGVDDLGIRRNSAFFLDLNGNRFWDGPAIDGVYGFGAASDTPVIGDWNGDGVDDLGVRRNSAFFLDLNGNRVWDAGDGIFGFGGVSDLPAIGDWNGDGVDDLGIRRNNLFFLDLNGNRAWDVSDGVFPFGIASDVPVIGDWNADGIDDFGIRRLQEFHLDLNGDRVWEIASDGIFPFGLAADTPVAGKW